MIAIPYYQSNMLQIKEAKKLQKSDALQNAHQYSAVRSWHHQRGFAQQSFVYDFRQFSFAPIIGGSTCSGFRCDVTVPSGQAGKKREIVKHRLQNNELKNHE